MRQQISRYVCYHIGYYIFGELSCECAALPLEKNKFFVSDENSGSTVCPIFTLSNYPRSCISAGDYLLYQEATSVLPVGQRGILNRDAGHLDPDQLISSWVTSVMRMASSFYYKL